MVFFIDPVRERVGTLFIELFDELFEVLDCLPPEKLVKLHLITKKLRILCPF
jgi:hypothetical protein